MSVEARLLIVETSGRAGVVAVAAGERLLGQRRLDEARRHARDLAPSVAELLREQGWRPQDLASVVVSRGPGSYTGLRVGLMSAKALAYATGCTFLTVETFHAVALQAPADVLRLDVLADAQQGKVYVQPFARPAPAADIAPQTPLAIRSLADWLAARQADAWAAGPGLHTFGPGLPADLPVVEAGRWDPLPESLLRIGLARFLRGERDDPWSAEPLYLRPSAAEEKWRRQEGG